MLFSGDLSRQTAKFIQRGGLLISPPSSSNKSLELRFGKARRIQRVDVASLVNSAPSHRLSGLLFYPLHKRYGNLFLYPTPLDCRLSSLVWVILNFY